MPKVPYPYEVNGKLVTGNGSLIAICSLSNRSLLPSLTVVGFRDLVGTAIAPVSKKTAVKKRQGRQQMKSLEALLRDRA